ncbi:MATE family efflux transporter [Brevibacillus ruminantium]|uniref:Multidrug export protein MepA n=1 Tax=Brevibacillus ruminantium TaxID=2950604 RepID=A0ABY4WNL2_9BACL|nr:MATE family efflux transporter [Brevibacillus ruminantium]USG68439.1 MATE family efflux transporter [Brevibacillus ruminantium]
MTDTTIKLRETPVRKLFFSYLVPSVLGMLLMSINIVVDGIFVGHGVGPHGLAGVNVAVPAFSIFLSISLWIGMGGATMYSIALGQNNREHARTVFSHAVTLAVVLVAVITILCLWKMDEIAYLFGANEVILPYVRDYLSILLTFGFVYVLENILSVFVRNDGNPALSMASLIVTAVLNVFFNYLFIFVWGMGVKGAAAATVLSAGLGFLVLLTHFLRKNSILRFVRFRFQPGLIKDILTIGFPSFVAEISIAVVTLGYNVAFMHALGETGVAAYAIVNYIHTVMLLFFLGIGAALQPISSFLYGAGLLERLQKSLRLSVQTALLAGVLAICCGMLFAGSLVSLFDVRSDELYQLSVKGLGLFFLTYLFLGYNLVYAEYFQSIGQIRKSLLIIVSQGVLLVPPFLWFMPKWLGVDGIWLVLPAVQAITALSVFVMNRLQKPVPTTVLSAELNNN